MHLAAQCATAPYGATVQSAAGHLQRRPSSRCSPGATGRGSGPGVFPNVGWIYVVYVVYVVESKVQIPWKYPLEIMEIHIYHIFKMSIDELGEGKSSLLSIDSLDLSECPLCLFTCCL